MDEKTREEIALKKFSLIAPVLNSHVDNQKEYYEKICSGPIEMPHYGFKNYNPNTLRSWLFDYRQGGLEALKPGLRSDRGKSRKISPEIMEKIQNIFLTYPRYSKATVYEKLIKDGIVTPEKLSPATFYRFITANNDMLAPAGGGENHKPEMKRFSHQYINELWQADLMYGPSIKVGRVKKQTYLSAMIDDASRIVPHAEFFFTQDFSVLRKTFKEAVLKRGLPKIVYSDNGKIYRCGQFVMVCATLGSSLIHAQPYMPRSKGKIERYFLTVRQRFLSTLDEHSVKSLDELNLRFCQWMEEDYHRKTHSSLGMSPLDFFMSQAHLVKMFPNPVLLDEYFLLRVERKVKHDATISLNNVLYETDAKLAGQKLEVRYDPTWLDNPAKAILLFHEGSQVGTARQVNFNDNAHAKRAGGKSIPTGKERQQNKANDQKHEKADELPKAAISFNRMMKEEVEDE